jgi:hypothetical protein
MLIKNKPNNAIHARLAYTLQESADIAGYSYWTLWRKVRSGELRPIKGLGTIRISKKELERFVNNPGEYKMRDQWLPKEEA